MTRMSYFRRFWFLVVATMQLGVFAQTPDIVAIVPDRFSVYRNGLHNALQVTAKRLNVSLEIRDVGNYDPVLSDKAFDEAIASPDQPKVYCIWPINRDANQRVRELYEAHNATIIQVIQYPEQEEEWEPISAFAGSDSSGQGANGAEMLINAMEERGIKNPKVVILAYPVDYARGYIIIDGLMERLKNSSVEVTDTIFLPWGAQPAYDAVLDMLDDIKAGKVHAIFNMDDRILSGAYQALQDSKPGVEVTLVGNICNGARELLQNGQQYGTILDSPFFNGQAAITAAVEYIRTGTFVQRNHFAPVSIITADSWSFSFVEYLGETYTVDQVCTWTLDYVRVAGILDVDQVEGICDFIACEFIPQGLLTSGYVMVSTIYFLALLGAMSLYVYRNMKVMQLAQPFFLGLVIVGSMVDATSIIFMSRDGQNYTKEELDRACMAWPWLLAIGHMMTTATLLAKIYRVKKVCMADGTSRSLRKAKVTIKSVSVFIVVCLLYDVIILSVWYSIDPFVWSMHAKSTDSGGYLIDAYGTCSSQESYSWVFPFLLLVGHLHVLIYANVLVYQTRRFHKISDSKNVAICLFNSIQLIIVASPLVVLFNDNVAANYLIRVLFVFLTNLWVLLLVVLQKGYVCVKGQGNVLPDFHTVRRGSATRLSGVGFEVGVHNFDAASSSRRGSGELSEISHGLDTKLDDGHLFAEPSNGFVVDNGGNQGSAGIKEMSAELAESESALPKQS